MMVRRAFSALATLLALALAQSGPSAETAPSQPQAGPPVAAPPNARGPIAPGPAPFAQFRFPLGAEQEEETSEGLFRSPDRETLRRLRAAREQQESGGWGDAARVLGELMQRIDAAEDFLYRPDPNSPRRQSLKREIEAAIAAMPEDGRQVFEEQFGGKARRRLTEALQAKDFGAVEEVARQLFYTQAGREATLLLARQELDRGHTVAAATLLERIYASGREAHRLEPLLSLWLAQALVDAGQAERGREILLALKRQTAARDLRVAGKNVRWFAADADPLTWMAEHFGAPVGNAPLALAAWLMPGGNAQRNSSQSGGRPLLNLRWRQLTYLDDDSIRVDRNRPGQDEIAGLERENLDNGVVALPVRQLLATRDQVLMRTTAGRIKAFAPRTGKLLWSYPSDAGVEFTQRAMDDRHAPGAYGVDAAASVAHRVFEDQTTGAMSSDGDTVYLVESLGAAARRRPRSTINLSGAQVNRDLGAQNSLSAIDIRTQGKLRWTIGGLRSDAPGAGASLFFGAPLPLDGRLYALAETKGQEIRLLAIQARTGQIEWSQGLVIPSLPTMLEPLRRYAGLSPSFADGVLVCPTNAGAVAAVDLTTRSLLWGFEYRRSVANNLFERGGQNVNPFGPNATVGRDGRQLDHWVDSSARIAGGRVVVTPADDDNVFCLELSTGKLLWKAPREKGLYVGCIDQERALVVGAARVWALDLSQGKPVWDLVLGADEHPSGRGFVAGGVYYLPLSSAEVLAVDVATGRVVSRARSREGSVPGNLVCYQGDLFSLGPKHLEKFSQLDTLRDAALEQLRHEADEPTALWGLAEVRREEGQTTEAIGLMRRAFAATHGREKEARRRQLIDTVLDGLSHDFAANRDVAADLEAVIVDPLQRHRYRRLTAVGLEKIGDSLAAFEATMQLADELSRDAASNANRLPTRDELDRVSEHYALHRDRWVHTQIAQMLKTVRPEMRAQLLERIAARIESAGAGANPDSAKRMMLVYGSHPRAEALASSALRRSPSAGRLELEDDLLWRRLARSADRTIAGEATAHLAAAYIHPRAPQAAAHWYQELRRQWAQETCAFDSAGAPLTGDQVIAALPDGLLKRLVLGTDAPLPRGQTRYRDDRRLKLSPQRDDRPIDMEWRGEPSEWLAGARLTWDRATPAVVALDALGRELFRTAVKLDEDASGEPNAPRLRRRPLGGEETAAEMYHARSFGRMLYLWLGSQLVAIDVYAATSPAAAADSAVVWSADLSAGGEPTAGNLHALPAPTAWGPVRRTVYDANERPVGGLGPINQHGLFLQRRGDLLCLDLATGREIWVRSRLPVGCELLGDAESIVVATADGANSLVLRAMDGEQLDRVNLPPREQRVMHVGCTLVSWRNNDQGVTTLAAWDAVRGVEIWRRDLERGARAEQAGAGALAVLEPSRGLFSLFEIGAAGPIAKIDRLPLGETNDVNKIYALRDHEQLVLIIDAKTKSGLRLRSPPIAVPGGPGSQLVSGALFGIDLQSGEKRWGPVEVKEHGLLLSQTAGSPLLAFVRNLQTRSGTGMVADASALLIDKRTGRVAFRNDKVSARAGLKNYDLQVDPEQRTVSLLLPDKAIVVELTDEPLVDADSDEARSGKPAADAQNAATPIAPGDSSPGDAAAPRGAGPAESDPTVRPALAEPLEDAMSEEDADKEAGDVIDDLFEDDARGSAESPENDGPEVVIPDGDDD